MDPGKRPAYPIESVENALKLILLFKERERISTAEAAMVIGVARSTAHRLLAMLQYYRFARQDPATRSYAAGPALLDVALTAIRSMDIRVTARPHMERLSREVGETVYLGIREGTQILFVESVESANPLRLGSRTGQYLDAYLSAIGRVQLAALTNAEVRALYPEEELVATTGSGMVPTIRTRTALIADLEEIRRVGYAKNLGTPEPDVSAIAAAVTDRNHQIRAGLAVAAPTSRLSAQQAPKVAKRVIRAAAAIGATLG